MRHRQMLSAVCLTATIVAAGLAQRNGSVEAKFQAAQHKEQVEGDLRAAIKLYQEVADLKEGNRAIAAQSLLRVGRCYEKLGSTEAQKAYQRLLRQYGDQLQPANEARARLATFNSAGRERKPGDLAATLLFRLSEHSTAYFGENVASDGRSIYHFVFTEFTESGETSLVATDVGTGKQRIIFRGKFWNFGVRLSPDGQRLAFIHYDVTSPEHTRSGKWSIYVVGVDGSNPHSVYTDSTLGLGRLMLIMQGWSPDGSQLVFTSGAGNAKGDSSFQLKLLSLTDGSVHVLRDFGPRDVFRREGTAAFSPDGQYVVYDFPEHENRARSIYILSRASTVPEALVEGQGNAAVLGWAPTSKELLFVSDRRGTVDAYRVEVKGGKVSGTPTLVKTDIGAVRPLGFTSSGAFLYMSQGLTRAVMTAKIDLATGIIAEKPRLVSQRFVDDVFTPNWSPDGTVLVYAANRSRLVRSAPVLTFRNMATGEEQEAPLNPTVGAISVFSTWSRDSRFLYLSGFDASGKRATFQVDARSRDVKPISSKVCNHSYADGLLCFDPSSVAARLEITTLNPISQAESFLRTAPRPAGRGVISFDGSFISYSPVDGKSIRLWSVGDGSEKEIVRARADETVAPGPWISDDMLAIRRTQPGQSPTYWLTKLNGEAQVQITGADFTGVIGGRWFNMGFNPKRRELVWVSDEGKNELWALENAMSVVSTTRAK